MTHQLARLDDAIGGTSSPVGIVPVGRLGVSDSSNAMAGGLGMTIGPPPPSDGSSTRPVAP
jgi:hypothetical protein